MGDEAKGAHVLIVPYPTQGHINPMLQLGKLLTTKGVKSTLATTVFIVKNTRLESTTVQIDTISNGFDQTGLAGAESIEDYLEHLKAIGSKTLSQLIVRHSSSSNCPFNCLIYDAVMPWVLDVVKKHGLLGASSFSQPATVNSIVYYFYGGMLPLPISSTLVSIPGEEQMKELAWGLKESCSYYLWVIRDSEQAELAKNVLHETDKKGTIVNWCPQLEVLASEATGCFLTHCGWNSMLEALSLGVRMVAMPQWADQPTNGALIHDIWKVGRQVSIDDVGS
ncbi:hypothetical protein Ancab_008667 [Ancistrocladus abbreviatus]